MDNDFETPNAITAVLDFTKEINKIIAEEKISENDAKKIKFFMKNIDKVFGVLEEEISVPEQIKELIKKRESARKNKDFKTSDNIREKIKSFGYWIDDTKEGPIIKKL